MIGERNVGIVKNGCMITVEERQRGRRPANERLRPQESRLHVVHNDGAVRPLRPAGRVYIPGDVGGRVGVFKRGVSMERKNTPTGSHEEQQAIALSAGAEVCRQIGSHLPGEVHYGPNGKIEFTICRRCGERIKWS